MATLTIEPHSSNLSNRETTIDLLVPNQVPPDLGGISLASDKIVIREDGSVELRSSPDDTLTKVFRELTEQWRSDTEYLSIVFQKAMHPAYQRIIGMGKRAVPLILRELKQEGGYWFWALTAITGEDPSDDPNMGYEETVEAWLDWGRERKYI